MGSISTIFLLASLFNEGQPLKNLQQILSLKK